jgi:hypothetical protein
LFRNELGFDHCPKITWALAFGLNLALWFVASSMPLLILFKASEGNLGTFFDSFGELTGFGLIWWLAMTGWFFAFALFPGISNPIQNVRAFEFMFTRAIDRRPFRIRAVLIYLMLLGPLLLSAVATGSQEAFLGNGDSTRTRRSDGSNTERRFLTTTSKCKSARNTRAIVIPRGAVNLTAWVFWLGTLACCSCKAIAQWWSIIKHNPWLAGLAVGVPVVAGCFFAP